MLIERLTKNADTRKGKEEDYCPESQKEDRIGESPPFREHLITYVLPVLFWELKTSSLNGQVYLFSPF
jgi:hypothetical protein